MKPPIRTGLPPQDASERDVSVEVGEEVVTRVELRVDRDMEYVHLKDQRGSGTEPVNVLSRYKNQDGLWYYESTRDTASHFFIDYLPRELMCLNTACQSSTGASINLTSQACSAARIQQP